MLGGAVVATAFAGSKLSLHSLSYQCEMSFETCVRLPNCLVTLQMNQNQSKEGKTTTNQVMWSYFSIVMVNYEENYMLVRKQKLQSNGKLMKTD